jgi:hypothetical protein
MGDVQGMMRAICGLAFVALLSGSTVPKVIAQVDARPRPFYVSSVGSTYPMAVSARGTYRVFADSLVVEIDSGNVVNQVPPEFGERGRVWGITLGVALGAGTIESWDTEAGTPVVKLPGDLLIGKSLPLPSMRFTLRGIDTIPLRDRWFALELGVQQDFGAEGLKAGPLYSYACTEEYVLGPTQASLARAVAQQKRYASVC